MNIEGSGFFPSWIMQWQMGDSDTLFILRGVLKVIIPTPWQGVKKALIRSFFWSVFSRIRIEYGEILRVSPHSVRMRENEGRMRTRITPNTVTFYAVLLIFRNYGFHFNQGNSKWPRGFAGKKTGCSFPRWFIIRYFIYINFKIKVLSFLLISSA